MQGKNKVITNIKKLSFIIPVYNEEEHLDDTIASIKKNVHGSYDYEIIVVDNGSYDNSISIAKRHGAKVYIKPANKISSLRNYGTFNSSGHLLIFLDADIHLEKEWGCAITEVIKDFEKNPVQITGSVVGIDRDPNWIEKYWFKPTLYESDITHMNSGHLIVTKSFFEKIGGFNENLETGEDYEFSQRAKKNGAIIINNIKLKVVHKGYPKTIGQFFKRERWHGRGDYIDFKSILSSKPAILSILLLILLMFSISISLIFNNYHFMYPFIIILSVFCVSAAFKRSKEINFSFLISTYLYSVYFFARALSFIDVMIEKLISKVKST